jgi:hypothetical protein
MGSIQTITIVKRGGRKEGKKHRKHGRNKKKPCHIAYSQKGRWNTNKLRKAEKRANRIGVNVVIKFDGEMLVVRPNEKALEKNRIRRRRRTLGIKRESESSPAFYSHFILLHDIIYME